jgi:hypothetical protein
VQNKDKEGYQATVLAGQSDETSARIMKQLDGQDGRPFGGAVHGLITATQQRCLPYCICYSIATAVLHTSALAGQH